MKIYFALGLALMLGACGDMPGIVSSPDDFVDRDGADQSALVTRWRCNPECPPAEDGVLLFLERGFFEEGFYVTSNWADFSDYDIDNQVRSFAVGAKVKVTFYSDPSYYNKIASYEPGTIRSKVSETMKQASSVLVTPIP